MTEFHSADESAPKGVTRRTVVKGAAWAVPVIAVASASPAYASSHEVPPPPSVTWGSACGTTGNGKGCSGQSTALQVPMTLTNDTDGPLLFVVEGAWSANGNGNPAPPATPPTPGSAGSGFGFFGFGTNASSCTTLTPPTECASITPIASASSKVLLTPRQTTTLWYAFNSTGDNASSFVGKIWFTWYDPTTCTEVGTGGTSQTASAIQPDNCHNLPNPPAV